MHRWSHVSHPKGSKVASVALGARGCADEAGPGQGPHPVPTALQSGLTTGLVAPWLLLVAREVHRSLGEKCQSNQRCQGGAQCFPPSKLRVGCPPEGQKWGKVGGTGGPKAWTVPPLSSVDDSTPPSSGTLSQTPACPSLTWTDGDQRGMGQVPFISQDKVGSRAGGSGATRHLSRALKPCFQGTGQSSPSTAFPP